MTRSGLCVAGVVALASMLSAQAPAPAVARKARPRLRPGHGQARSRARAAAARAATPPPPSRNTASSATAPRSPKPASASRSWSGSSRSGTSWQDWEKVAEMLETGMMPPLEATEQPTDAERKAAAAWIRDVVEGLRNRARGRARARDRPPADQRRIRLRGPRPDRHRRQGRHRCVERLGRRRGVRQLRRCPVRAG